MRLSRNGDFFVPPPLPLEEERRGRKRRRRRRIALLFFLLLAAAKKIKFQTAAKDKKQRRGKKEKAEVQLDTRVGLGRYDTRGGGGMLLQVFSHISSLAYRKARSFVLLLSFLLSKCVYFHGVYLNSIIHDVLLF